MIDRRVQILEGSNERTTATTVSGLRDRPYVVLLGEPGIGKTTVLDAEAAQEGTTTLKVRELINDTVAIPAGTLFLDALDEFRVGQTDFDKAHQLAKAIRLSGATRWRLTCRSEDWQKGADVAAIRRGTGGTAITVAQLLPLDLIEATAVLASLGEPDPRAFVARGVAMGAAGLLESPLSLKLLRQSVSGGRAWPATRFALFDQATNALAHEDNDVHRLDRSRASADVIIAAAARACLVLLTTGSRFLWRSGALPPSGDARAFLPASTLGIDQSLIDDMLGSALFRGEGEAFEPVHRTIAEFLGGRALARTVTGDTGGAALPLGRARALVTGGDGRAPTDLRGLFAWFAAHLAALGAHGQARELVEGDAVSVLTYGDAAAFDADTKRTMLANLDRHDPYFRASEVGVTAVGGLASEEIADDLARAIEIGDGTHRMMTVYEVLSAGPAVPSLQPVLRKIALDPARPEWQRTRAVAAWLNGSSDTGAAARELFDALAGETPSAPREALRAELLVRMQRDTVTLDDIKSVIGDFAVAPGDSTVMRLFGLRQLLVADPRPELFDEPFDWLPVESRRRHSIDVDGVIDHALAAAIRATPDLTAARLWRWLIHVRDDKWTNLGDAARPAVTEWLAAAAGRDVDVFEAVLADDVPEEGPWMIGTYYYVVAGPPNAAILDRLTTLAIEATGTRRRRLLAVVVNIGRRYDVGEAAYWRLYAFLEAMPRGNRGLLRELTVAQIEPWRRHQYRRTGRRTRAEAKQRDNQLRTLRRLIPGMVRAANTSALSWAAEIYFHPRDKKGEGLTPIDRLAAEVDDEVLDAILTGWRHLARSGVPGIDPRTLGEIEATGGHYYAEYGAIAGLDRLRAEAVPADLMALPQTLAIIVLRTAWIAHPTGTREALENWAWQRLNIDPVVGAAALQSFWEAVLAGGAINSSSWQHAGDDKGGQAVALACTAMLEHHPAMAVETLRTLVAAAAKHLDRATLGRLAAAALIDPSVAGKQRALWSVIVFACDPLAQHGQLNGHATEDLLDLFDSNSGIGLLDGFTPGSDAEQVALASAVFSALAPHAEPYVERRRGRVLLAHRLSDASNTMLKRLGATSAALASDAIAHLRTNIASYPDWDAALRHAAEQQARARRDLEHLPPMPAAVTAALAGKAPVNAADLRAIVVDELRRFGRELRTGPTAPWRDYWNTDSNGKPVSPKIENIARDLTLTRLQDRLARYQIAVSLPEAQRRDDTRADILFVTGVGRNLPIEAKRHYHDDLWTAASVQLQGYASDEKADGFGVLLVFWFGDVARTPARVDRAQPATAAELQALLIADLSPALRDKTDIVVLDVSAPERAKNAKAGKTPRAVPVRAPNAAETTPAKRAPRKSKP